MSKGMRTRIGIILVVGSVSGCASMDEEPYRFSDGWRHAKVVKVLQGIDVKRPGFWDCLKGVPEQERLQRTYVVANYRGVNRHQDRLVPAPSGETLRPGDRVHLNVGTCEGAIVKRDPTGQ